MLAALIDILMLRSLLWQEKELKTRHLVETSFSVLNNFHERQMRGELSEADAQAAAVGIIRAMRYEEKEYFWINDLGQPFPKMIMHPISPELEGQLLDAKEYNSVTRLRVGIEGPFTQVTDRKNLFVTFSEVVRQGGQGYVTYLWPKPLAGSGVSEALYPKLSYVKKFAPWGWLIGSGIYIDDVESIVQKQVMRVVWLVVGFGMLLLFIASLMARSITDPLQRTITTMRTIGKSDNGLALRLPVEGGSEIAELAVGFNEMLERLEERDAELAQHREHLEEEVALRTEDLQNANVRLAAERKEIESLLNKMEATHSQLLHSEKMASIGQLAAGVAHEINNPIGFVHSNLSTLNRYAKNLIELVTVYELLEMDGAQPDEIMTYIREMKERMDLAFIKEDLASLISETNQGIERVSKIVQDLKDFSRLDREDVWEPDDVHQGLDSAINVAWSQLKQKCQIRKEYGDLPLVECLHSQLNQVFLNILVNAAQAIENEGVITLRSGVEGNTVWLDIADTGTGIPAEIMKRIFEPFFTTKPVGKGTGLGLTIAYNIIKKHNGRIGVASEPGKG
ncbi:MAG: cache domain-containing protein, partial [Betaproteobacteria bacterium]